MSAESVRAASRWTTRVIPLVLAASVGYATYVTVARICGMCVLTRSSPPSPSPRRDES